jgi:uncharacterized protein
VYGLGRNRSIHLITPPYIQHRGGPAGFLKMIDEHTLAFADYRGNKQYISTGNLAADDRVCLVLMDYPHRARLKIYARAQTIGLDDDRELAALVAVPGYRAKLERIFRFRLESFDWNCPQHITPRFTEAEVSLAVSPMRAHLTELEAENEALRTKLAALGNDNGDRPAASPSFYPDRGRNPEGPTS